MDTEEIRSLITDPWAAYCYCIHIKNDPKIRKYVTDKFYLNEIKKNEIKKICKN